MTLLNRFKKEIIYANKLRKALDFLLSQIESTKVDLGLDKIFEVIGRELQKMKISLVVSIIDDKRKNVIVRHISIGNDDKLIPPKDSVIKKVSFSKLDKYKIVLEKKETLFCKSRIDRFNKYYKDTNIFKKIKEANSIIAPLILQGEIIGFFEVLSPELEKTEIQIIKKFSQKLAIRIVNIILFQEVRESEKRYRNLFERAQEGFIIFNYKQKKFIDVNQKFCEISGYTRDELLQMNCLLLLDKSERVKISNFTKERFRVDDSTDKALREYETIILTKKGESRYIRISIIQIISQDECFAIVEDISEGKKAEKALRESEEKYKTLTEDSLTGIFIHQDGKYVFVNDRFAEIHGYTPEQLQGNKYWTLIHSDDREKVKEIVSKRLAGKTAPRRYEIRRREKNGRTIWCEMMATVIKHKKRPAIMGNVIDITERKQAEEEIRRLNEFNKRILDNAPVSIMTLDKEGNIISVNSFIKEIAGHRDYVGRNIYTIPFINREGLVNEYKNLLKRGVAFHKDNCIYYGKSHNKTIKYLNIIAVPLLNNKKQIVGAISMALDNTEAILTKQKIEELNKDLEKKVIQRTWQLDAVNKELSKVLELKSKFISDASHELRTPLTVVRGNLDLAVREIKNTNKKVPETFSLINKEIEQMTSVLTDLTILTNADSQSENIAHEKINLKQLVNAVVQSLKVLANERHIKIKYKKGLKRLEIMGDEAKIEKLLLNIVRNAIKYNKKSGWIKIWLEKGDNEARIAVEDSGIGIPRQDLPYIFERFYRADKARSGSEGGTGLGLSICKWIIEAHGGYINVESKLAKGSKFVIHLPHDFKKQKLSVGLF